MKMLLDEFTPQTGTNTKSNNQKVQTELAKNNPRLIAFLLVGSTG